MYAQPQKQIVYAQPQKLNEGLWWRRAYGSEPGHVVDQRGLLPLLLPTLLPDLWLILFDFFDPSAGSNLSPPGGLMVF